MTPTKGHVVRRMGFEAGATYWCGADWSPKALSYYTASAAQKAQAKGKDVCGDCITRALAARKTFTPTTLEGKSTEGRR